MENKNKKFVVSPENPNGILIDMTATELAQREIDNSNIPSELDYAMKNLRLKRNVLLSETDYLALSDNTMSSAMRTYRQALRDLTNGLTTVEQVEAVIFPEKPV
tara:strand:+ start:482 stop:793 length:312 start_codon:yes stop_codon:yes gene_type:complete